MEASKTTTPEAGLNPAFGNSGMWAGHILEGNYCKELEDILAFARFINIELPTAHELKALDHYIMELKVCGVWDRLTMLYVFYYEQAGNFGRINLKRPRTQDYLVMGTGGGLYPVFRPYYKGWYFETSSRLSTCWFNTNYTNAPTDYFTQNSNHIGVVNEFIVASAAKRQLGSFGLNNRNCITLGSNDNVSCSDDGVLTFGTNYEVKSKVLGTRVASNSIRAFTNGVLDGTKTRNSVAIVSTFYIGSTNLNNPNTDGGGVISMAQAGLSLTDSNARDDYQAWQRFRYRVGENRV